MGTMLGMPEFDEFTQEVAGVLADAEDGEWMKMARLGLENLCQDFADRDEKYAREHFITGDGAPRPEATETERSVKARFRELLEQHPELTRQQAYMQAVMEIIGYRGYLVPPKLAPGVLAYLEANDANSA